MADRAKWQHYPSVQVGDVFGQLTVLAQAPGVAGKDKRWLLRCECGNEVSIIQYNLRPNKKSDGQKKCGKGSCAPNHKHGQAGTRLWNIWCGIKDRCRCPTNQHFPYYGGRGITLCDEWSDFLQFAADMGPSPSNLHSIDRIDVNGNYEPGNCKWATHQEQMENRRNNTFIEFDGLRLTISQWARRTGLSEKTISGRVARKFVPADILTVGRLPCARGRGDYKKENERRKNKFEVTDPTANAYKEF